MLKNIHIKNLALIKEADIDLESGLNIMTGETGAGKSIIIGSVNIGLGDKADKGLIRTGEASALVELSFVTKDEKVLDTLRSFDIEPDGSNIIISRKITPEASFAKINGETVTLSKLKAITGMLVDVHGQHDHQSLLNPQNHISIVDEFGGSSLAGVKSDFTGAYNEYKSVKKELMRYDMDEDALEREKDLLIHELDEIEKANLTDGEDERLEAEYKKLLNAEKISENTNKASAYINGENTGLTAKISDVVKEISDAAKVDTSLETLKKQLIDIDSLIKDAGHDISRYISENRFDEALYRDIKDRLNLINRLKDRYGNSIEKIGLYAEGIRKKLEGYTTYSKEKDELVLKLKKTAAEVREYAKKLSEERLKAADALEPMIIGNLKDLNFLDCNFKINFERADKISSKGYDKIEFVISTNPGEELKPLQKVASGGELSRIMLAIKSSIADADNIETLIFDEIDTGISGATAFKVAEKLKYLSCSHQIILITHLPQIAAMADSHFEIEKSVNMGNTISGIRRLNDRESEIALARLLGSDKITEAALTNAIELKKRAGNKNLQ